MGIFNKAIPKYTRNLIDNSLVVEPVEEPVTVVDDVYDPVLNKAVRERLMSTYGNPIGATLGGYYELINNAFMGNKQQGGTMLPGIGVLSSFGRSMDKTGDVILGTLTEATKGLTGQGVESPLYNIFTEDEDYSGQRYLAAAANSMAKLANAPTLTEDDFGGVWTIPALGIDLATDPSILGGNLTKIAKGQGAVAEAGKILQDYDDIMSKVAIDATAPGLRPLGKKFGAKINSYLSNLRSEQDLQDAILKIDNYLTQTVIALENGEISPEEFQAILQKASNYVENFKKVADEDVVAKPLKEMSEEVTKATQHSPPISSFRDEYAFLSNMFESPITIDGVTYRNAEAAFQAGKLDDPNLRTQFSNLSGVDAKKLGKKVKLRKDWDKYKVEHMRNVLKAKFEQNPDLMQMLQDTGNSPLIEGNDWGDYFWGVVTDRYGYSEGGNVLGNLLEEVRGTLSKPDPSPYGRFRTRLNRLKDYAKMDSVAKQTGLKLDESLDTNRQAVNEIIDLMDKSMPFDTARKSFVELYKNNPELMLKDLGVYSYQDTVNKTASRVPSDEELQALHKQIQKDSVERAALRQGLKSKGQILTDSAIETYGHNTRLPQDLIDSIKKDIETLKKPASYTVGDYTPKSELLDSTKSKGFSSEENTEYFLSKLPSSFVDKYNITNQKDLIKMLQTNDPEELADLEDLFSKLVQKEGYVSDSLKISQSMSKLDPEIQIRIANNIQHLMSNILTEAVNKGIVSAKDISENTLDDLFNEIYDIIWAYERTGNKTIDSYRAFSKYSYNKDYLKQKLRQPALKMWHDIYLYDEGWSLNENGIFEWKRVPLMKKYPDANAYYHMKDTRLQDTYGTFNKYLDSLAAGVRKRIAEFETEGADRLKSPKIVDDFLNESVLMNNDGETVLTIRDLANKMVDDEYNGKIPIQPRKPRFSNISSREKASASKMIEEFQEFYNLVGAYQTKGGLLKYPIPAKLAKYSYTSEDLAKLQEMPKLKKGISRTKDLDDFMQYIQDVVKNYEININSKIAGRLPDDNFVKYIEYDRSNEFEDIIKPYLDSKAMSKLGRTTSESSIGYSNAINKILQRVNFDDLIDVYNLMHKRFKTSKGTFSLAELGFEVDRLPKSLSNKLKSSLEYDLTKPVKVGDKEMSFVDYITKKIPKTMGSYNIKLESPEDFATFVISETNYNDTFTEPLNIGWKTMWGRMKDMDLGALVRKPDINLYPVETEFTKFAGISKETLRKTFEEDYFAKQREQFISKLSDPNKYYDSLLNRYVTAVTDPKLHYLNRLRSDLGTATFDSIQSVIKNSKDIGTVTAEIKMPSSKKIARFNEIYEESITKTIEELPNETFEQVVSNPWKIFQESDYEKRADLINNMFPDQTPITAAELKIYDEFGSGGKSPVTRTISQNHPIQVRLYDIVSKEFKNSIVSKQDRNAVLSTQTIGKLVTKAEEVQNVAGESAVTQVLTLLDKQRGSMVKGTDIMSDIIMANGRKIIAFESPKLTGNTADVAQMKAVADAIKYNIDVINKAAGGEVLKPIHVNNTFGQVEIGYQLTGNQKLFKNLQKVYNTLSLQDIIFEQPTPLTAAELKFLDKYRSVVEVLNDVQKQASDYYTKLGFNYSDSGFFKHTFKNTPNWQKFVQEHYYKGINATKSEELAEMCINLGYFGDFKGQFGAVPNSRVFEGNISRYNGIFDTDLTKITKGTFTKGVFANEKFQTTMSIFDNAEFKLNTYCKNIDDVKNILNSEANRANLTIASVKYNADGMISGFKKYDNFSDASLNQALRDGEAVFLPTHIFATLDKFCKQKVRMSNKAYAFISRYLTAPFKIGVLLNPGFLLGNMNDAYLKQATTLAKKYGTTVSEELANVASSVRTTIYLNNKFTDIYEKYLKDLDDYGVEIPDYYKMSLQVAKSKSIRDMFTKYLNGQLTYEYDKATKTASYITPSLNPTEEGLAKVWIHLNAVQPTEGITQELAGSVLGKSNAKLNYARNPIDRILYGMYHYKGKDVTTYGLLNHPVSKTYFGISEATESLARSSAILNDLKHQGIDLTEFAKLLGELDNTEFNVKMVNAINTMHHANFDYNASSPVLEGLESFVPFPTFWLKNISYWFDMFINNPQQIDAILDVQEGLWQNEDTESDEFKAQAKGRGAIPLSSVSEPRGQNLSKFFRGIYKPSPFQSMYSAASALNNPLESTIQRTHPLIQGTLAGVGHLTNLTTLQDPEDIRYRPYNTDQYQPNIKSTDEEFNPLAYTAHKANPLDRTINTALRTPGKIKKGEAQLSDFLPSVFQPDFSKK